MLQSSGKLVLDAPHLASTDASAEGRHATGRRVVKSPTTLSMSGWTSGRSKMVRFSVTPPPPLQADSTLA